jgi:hypothetical protein
MHITLRGTVCALVAAGLFLGAACGDDDSNDVTTGPAAPSAADVAGSDQHLRNLAGAGAAQAELYAEQQAARAAARPQPGYVYSGGQADSLGYQERANAATSARLGRQAEQYTRAQAAEAHADAERQAWAQLADQFTTAEAEEEAAQRAAQAEALAHLDGQAQTYGGGG